MPFFKKLANAIRKNNSLVCVGLDPDISRIPEGLSIIEFNRAIIEATSDLVCAYKPNFAFYEASGMEGIRALMGTIECIPEDIPVIGDAKRGDIGNTARAYAEAVFNVFGCDAVTVNPYLGYDSLEPFIKFKDRGIFVLCRTSNSGAVDFQSLNCNTGSGERALFEIVADKVNSWNTQGNLGMVVGATYPEELKLIRENYPDMPLLIPGVGAQGGELSQVVNYGVDGGREKTIINSSRQILYASKGKDFTEAARQAAIELRDLINSSFSKRGD